MRKILLLLPLFLIVSCSTNPKNQTKNQVSQDGLSTLANSTTRNIAAVEGAEFIFEQTYNALINPTVKTITLQPLVGEELEAEKNKLRLENTRKLLNRYKENFYIGEALLMEFDKELDGVYADFKAKKSFSLDGLKDRHVNILIGREYIEFHTHEIAYIYDKLLAISHGRQSGDKNVANEVIADIKNVLTEQWDAGNRMAVFNLGIVFDDINEEVKRKNPKAKVPGIKRYTFRDAENMNMLAKRSREFQVKFQDTMISKESLNSWLQYRDSRKAEAMAQREPDADNIKPDAGSIGNMTGSKFPANTWAMTYDDGPHPTYTKGMTDAMKKHGMKGTFFWLSANMSHYPEVVGAVGKLGHKRASHSYTHQNLPKLGDSKLNYEISTAADVFKNIVGASPTFFRCPYGACGSSNSKIRRMIADRSMIHAFWNVDSLDWQDKSPKSIYNRVVKQMEINGKGIVLFHDIHPQSVAAVELLMAYFKTKPELKFYTLDQVVNMQRKAAGNSEEYVSP